MKRKIITAVVTGLLVLSLGTGAMAASQGHGGGGCQGQYFVDEDGDGVCDHWTGEGACPARHGESAPHGCQGGHRHQNGHHRR